MGEIKDKIREQKALDEMESNAVLRNKGISVGYVLYIDGEYTDGGMTSTGVKYSDKTTRWDITDAATEELIETDEREEWINDNVRRYEGRGFGKYRNVSSQIYVKATITCTVEYFNERTIELGRIVTIDETTHYAPVTEIEEGSELRVVSEDDDGATLEVNGQTVEFNKMSVESDESEFSRFLQNYLSYEEKLVLADINVEEKEDSLQLSFRVGGDSYPVRFKPPFNDDNTVWDVAGEAGFEDPINLQDERLKICPMGVSTLGTRLSKIRVVNPDLSSKKRYRLIDKIRSFF